jgi:hypothetical protein
LLPLSLLQSKLSSLNNSPVNAHGALFVQSIERWFGSSKYKAKGFYKFSAPCQKHPLYREGDSWSEELGVSYRVLRRSIDPVCQHYKTKSLYKQAQDKFNGKLYASYVDRKTSQTYYIRNNALAEQFFKFVEEKKESMRKRKEAVQKSVDKSVGRILKGFGIDTNSNYSDVQNSTPLRACALNTIHNLTSLTSSSLPERHSPDRSEVKLSNQNSFEGKQPTAAPSEEEIRMVDEMVNIFNSLTQSKFKLFKNWYHRLLIVLKENFNGSIKIWKNYCRRVSSIDFLMGRAKNSNFKAVFWWLVKKPVIEDILEGAYGGHNFSLELDESEVLNAEIKKVKDQIANMDALIEDDRIKIQNNQKKNVFEAFDNLSEKEHLEFREEFYRQYKQYKPFDSTMDRIDRIMNRLAYETFVHKKIFNSFGFSSDIEPPIELVEHRKNLILEFESLQKTKKILQLQYREENRKVIEFFEVPQHA